MDRERAAVHDALFPPPASESSDRPAPPLLTASPRVLAHLAATTTKSVESWRAHAESATATSAGRIPRLDPPDLHAELNRISASVGDHAAALVRVRAELARLRAFRGALDTRPPPHSAAPHGLTAAAASETASILDHLAALARDHTARDRVLVPAARHVAQERARAHLHVHTVLDETRQAVATNCAVLGAVCSIAEAEKGAAAAVEATLREQHARLADLAKLLAPPPPPPPRSSDLLLRATAQALGGSTAPVPSALSTALRRTAERHAAQRADATQARDLARGTIEAAAHAVQAGSAVIPRAFPAVDDEEADPLGPLSALAAEVSLKAKQAARAVPPGDADAQGGMVRHLLRVLEQRAGGAGTGANGR
ncbi:hypothetical protein H9P43_008087 [Blastocladiella emersonii ATCC 22665]|nr:hypothetical protein H9P43_008087 [Blastocladiella emersonii ATCC 22665]